MRTLAFTQPNTLAKASLHVPHHKFTAKIQAVGAATGLVGGIGSGLLGAVLIVAGWFAVSKDVRHWLSTAGSVMLLLTIPLIILGAFCLDWLEKEKSHRCSTDYRYEDDAEGEI